MDMRSSCPSFCFPNATAPLVIMMHSWPRFWSSATCSMIEARRPRAKPLPSEDVITALPSWKLKIRSKLLRQAFQKTSKPKTLQNMTGFFRCIRQISQVTCSKFWVKDINSSSFSKSSPVLTYVLCTVHQAYEFMIRVYTTAFYMCQNLYVFANTYIVCLSVVVVF